MTPHQVHVVARVAGVPYEIALEVLKRHNIPIEDEEWVLV